MKSPKVIISGGGTGGHIFPAVAIANGIKDKYPDAQIKFVGAKGRMEMEKVPQAGYPIEGLWISGLQRRLTFKNFLFPFKVIVSVLKAFSIVRKFKPDIAIGVGGYASGPLLYAASAKGIPCLIQEQNSYPGITNKILAKRVKKICVAYDNMERFFPKEKIVLTGNPVRKEITKMEGKRDRGIELFKLDPNKLTLLIVGGSLGARSVNIAIDSILEKLVEKGIQIVWQTGKLYTEQAAAAVKRVGSQDVHVHEFIREMDLGYAVADMVVSRAGALAVSELCLVKKPCILVPLPSAAEDHQTKNAMALVNHHAAVLVKDLEAKTHLFEEIERMIDSAEVRDSMSKSIEKLGAADATSSIISEIMTLING